MPIVKIPLKHKFGIVSLSRAESLLKEKREKSTKKGQRSSSSVQITREFVEKYNACSDTERDKLNTVLQRAILHAKYRTGSPQSRAESVVDLSSTWLELTLICQCYGPHQQDALSALVVSLNSAPLSVAHVSSIFYVVGLCCQWLKSDELSENILRSGELLLLKILYLSATRLYYHHLVGAIADLVTVEEVQQLKSDLEGFEGLEKSYMNFPESLLQWKFALEVALLIIATYCKPVSEKTPSRNSATQDSQQSSPAKAAGAQSDGVAECSSHSSAHGHGLAPILWHSLDVWQCVTTGNDSLQEAIDDLVNCSAEFNTPNWLEGAFAMCLLCAASQTNIDILSLLQSLAIGRSDSSRPDTKQSSLISPEHSASHSIIPGPKRETRFNLPPSVPSSAPKRTRKPSTLNILGVQPEFDAALLGSAITLCTIQQASESEPTAESYYPSTIGTQSLIESEVIPETVSSMQSSQSAMFGLGSTEVNLQNSATSSKQMEMAVSQLIPVDGHTSVEDNLEESVDILKKVSLHSPTSSAVERVGVLDARYPTQEEQKVSTYDEYAYSQAPLSDGAGILGSQVAPSTAYRRSVFSTPNPQLSLDNEPLQPCLKSWSPEVALLYTAGMADAVIYGHTSSIQRQALLGDEVGTGEYGLVQLAGFTDEEKTKNVCWTIRHVAMLGLSRVVHVCGGNPIKSGLSHVAWAAMMERDSKEPDSRVSEAIKLSQACPDFDKPVLSDSTSQPISSPLLGYIGDSLCRLFLPSVLPHCKPPTTGKRRPKITENKEFMDTVRIAKPKVSTRSPPRIAQVSSFNTRTMGALNKIAEEHWRRQMDEEKQLDHQEQLAEEERQKKLYEEKMKRKAAKLARNKPKTITS